MAFKKPIRKHQSWGIWRMKKDKIFLKSNYFRRFIEVELEKTPFHLRIVPKKANLFNL